MANPENGEVSPFIWEGPTMESGDVLRSSVLRSYETERNWQAWQAWQAELGALRSIEEARRNWAFENSLPRNEANPSLAMPTTSQASRDERSNMTRQYEVGQWVKVESYIVKIRDIEPTPEGGFRLYTWAANWYQDDLDELPDKPITEDPGSMQYEVFAACEGKDIYYGDINIGPLTRAQIIGASSEALGLYDNNSTWVSINLYTTEDRDARYTPVAHIPDAPSEIPVIENYDNWLVLCDGVEYRAKKANNNTNRYYYLGDMLKSFEEFEPISPPEPILAIREADIPRYLGAKVRRRDGVTRILSTDLSTYTRGNIFIRSYAVRFNNADNLPAKVIYRDDDVVEILEFPKVYEANSDDEIPLIVQAYANGALIHCAPIGSTYARDAVPAEHLAIAPFNFEEFHYVAGIVDWVAVANSIKLTKRNGKLSVSASPEFWAALASQLPEVDMQELSEAGIVAAVLRTNLIRVTNNCEVDGINPVRLGQATSLRLTPEMRYSRRTNLAT